MPLAEIDRRSHVDTFHRRKEKLLLPVHERRPRGVVGWCAFQRCGQAVSSWRECVQHQLSSHFSAAQRDAVCTTCLDVFPAGGLQSHLEAHRRGDEPCSLCPARFIGAAGLARHKKDFHHATPTGSLPTFVPAWVQALAPASAPATGRPGVVGRCTSKGCKSVFGSWEGFVAHFQATHIKKGSTQHYVCPRCLHCVPISDEKSHIDRHSKGKRFGCQQCSAQFLNSNALKTHVKMFHCAL